MTQAITSLNSNVTGTKTLGGKQHDPTSMAIDGISTEGWKQSSLSYSSLQLCHKSIRPSCVHLPLVRYVVLDTALRKHFIGNGRKILYKNFLHPRHNSSHDLALWILVSLCYIVHQHECVQVLVSTPSSQYLRLTLSARIFNKSVFSRMGKRKTRIKRFFPKNTSSE